MTNNFEVLAAFGPDGDMVVELRVWGGVMGTFTPREALDLALSLLNVSQAAMSSNFLLELARNTLGYDEQQAVELVRRAHVWREAQYKQDEP